jgi:hypothetical protein
MSLGEVDTLNLLTEKLDNLFNESQSYYESFLDTNNLYKNGKISDKEFFEKLGDYVVAYSALEFLSIKVILEMKKALARLAGGKSIGGTQSPGLMPGMGSHGMMAGGMGLQPPPRMGTAQNPVGGPPSIVSAKAAFGEAGTLPSPDPSLITRSTKYGQSCSSCGAGLRQNAKFCTKCGTKV